MELEFPRPSVLYAEFWKMEATTGSAQSLSPWFTKGTKMINIRNKISTTNTVNNTSTVNDTSTVNRTNKTSITGTSNIFDNCCNKETKNVIVIPASKPTTSNLKNTSAKRRTAAYARVSTLREYQQNSYEAQIRYYTSYIQKRTDWEFAGMYSDEGVTGTSTKKRLGFQQMMQDAIAGKIDLIITKSVSRFARNTVDSLSAIRTLKENGVEVYFEKENIWTFDSKGELLITIMSSLAQEESRSISENTRWGMRKAFQDGKAFVPFKHFLGYDRGPKGELVVNKEQAETVRLIYSLFLDGWTFYAIAAELTRRKIPTPYGKRVWSDCTVKNILSNEKYKGDALLQKRYSKDFLNRKMIPNKGQVPQYYVSQNHEAIIEPTVFEQVQNELKKRAAIRKQKIKREYNEEK